MDYVMTDRYIGIIVAAGTGTRMQSALPKTYLPLLGKTVLHASINAMMAEKRFHALYVVLSPADTFFDQFDWSAFDQTVCFLRTGGATRAQTVIQTLQAISDQTNANDWVLIHDAARPCLSKDSLSTLIDQTTHDAVGGLLAIPLADTLKEANRHHRAQQTLDRACLWQAQTPQMFRYQMLLDALIKASSVTDEASAIEAAGYQPKLITGCRTNLKITYPSDLFLAEAILLNQNNQENAL